ncbi:MAG: hypothetical protein MUC69_09985 [Gemmatimonadales bacterium]|nr:hypothetical protein [Gemmatimonadales bacterium]
MRLHTLGGAWLEGKEGQPMDGMSPRRFAVLAMVASAGRGGLTRDALLGCLWPESATEQGRHALAQMLYSLRRSTGGLSLLTGENDLRLDPATLSSDVGELLAASDAGDDEAVAALYGGPFLDGFHLDDAPEFERWLDDERRELARLAGASLERLAFAASTSGDVSLAVEYWRRRQSIDPLDSRVALAYLEALVEADNRAGALTFAKLHEERVRRELDVALDARLAAYVRRLRLGTAATGLPPMPVPTTPVPSAPGATPSREDRSEVDISAESLAARARYWRWLALGSLALLAAIALWQPRRRAAAPPSMQAPVRSVAVLPFANLGADQDDAYIGDGLADNLISRLGALGELRVVARTSSFAFRGQRANMADIGRALDVGTLVEGSVRRQGDSLRVTARLVDSRTGFELWTGSWERPFAGIFALEDDLASEIVAALRPELGDSLPHPAAHGTTSVAAYAHYLRGRAEWRRRTPEALAAALAHFDSAVGLDARYAAAHAGAADVWMLMPTYAGMPPSVAYARARVAAERALRERPDLTEARVTSAMLRLLMDWDWYGADAEFVRAIAADEHQPTARQWHAINLLVLNQSDAALDEARVARQLDPLAPAVGAGLAAVHYFSGRPRESIVASREVLARDSAWAPARNWLGLALLAQGNGPDALRELERAVRDGNQQPLYLASLAYALAREGQADSARALLRRLEAAQRDAYFSPVSVGLVYGALGDRDRAMALLQQGVADRDPAALTLARDPKADPLREVPDFASLLYRLGLR